MLEIQQLARGCCSRHVNFTLRRRYICKEYVESLPRDGLTRIWQEEGPRAIIGSSIVFWILELGHNMAGSSVFHRTKQGTSDRGTVLGSAAGCSGHNTSTECSGLLARSIALFSCDAIGISFGIGLQNARILGPVVFSRPNPSSSPHVTNAKDLAC